MRATKVVHGSEEGRALKRRELSGTVFKIGTAVFAMTLLGRIGGKAPVVSAKSLKGDGGNGEIPKLIAMEHELRFQIKSRTFSSNASFSEEQSTLKINADTGVTLTQTLAPTLLVQTLTDSDCKQLQLTLEKTGDGESEDEELSGILQIGTFHFTAQGSVDKVVVDLFEQAEHTPDVEEQIPDIGPLNDIVSLEQDGTFGELLTGTTRSPRQSPGCRANCACCRFKGGAICCIICFFCDIFSLNVQDLG
jgi:hypothetical protein